MSRWTATELVPYAVDGKYNSAEIGRWLRKESVIASKLRLLWLAEIRPQSY